LLAILVACLFKKMGTEELADTSMPVPDVTKSNQDDLGKHTYNV